jgi:hypothetical protein
MTIPGWRGERETGAIAAAARVGGSTASYPDR